MVHMSTDNHLTNNQKLRALIEGANLTQAAAMTIFNRGQARPVTESGFKAWLADPSAVRYRPLSDELLQHADKVLNKLQKTRI